jgi:uncharacterized protein
MSQSGKQKPFNMNHTDVLRPGQTWARTRWNSQASGASFDQRKRTYLTREMQVFIESRDFCIVSFLHRGSLVAARLLYGQRGEFAAVRDDHHLVIRPLNCSIGELSSDKVYARSWRLGLIFIEFKTRKRACIHATGKWEEKERCLVLEVSQCVFHCAKYIDPNNQIARFAFKPPRMLMPNELARVDQHPHLVHSQLTDFLSAQRVAFICTVDRDGQCAVNHRGGQRGFISVHRIESRECVLLRDYVGNGAFEAIGNIWETRRAAVFVLDPERGCGVCISGPAETFDGEVLQHEPFVKLSGAKRVVAVHPLHCEFQFWNEELCLSSSYNNFGSLPTPQETP